MHPLDNVVWSALGTGHAALAEGGPLAKRYPPAFARFAALAEPTPAAFEALAALLPEDEEGALFTVGDVAPTAHFETIARRDMVQMVVSPERLAPVDRPVSALDEQDIDGMRALVALTQPGPFCERTHELGQFLGIRIDGRLAAMAGERMRLSAHTEVSAVCTHPEFQGRGFGRTLILAVCHGIVARGHTPFLHVFADNLPAITLYEKLGFEQRAALRLTIVRRQPLR